MVLHLQVGGKFLHHPAAAQGLNRPLGQGLGLQKARTTMLDIHGSERDGLALPGPLETL